MEKCISKLKDNVNKEMQAQAKMSTLKRSILRKKLKQTLQNRCNQKAKRDNQKYTETMMNTTLEKEAQKETSCIT